MSTRARENSKKLIICKERLNRLFEELDQLCVGPDMTVGSFLRALRRFIARSGRPHRNWKVGQDRLAKEGIEWKFINERAPWCVGYWECLVRSIKVALSKVIGRCHAKPDELHKVLCEMEARINGRPLTTVSDIPDGQLALTQALCLPKICQKPKLVPNVHRLKHLTPLQLADIHYKAWEKGGTRRCSFDLRMDHSGQMTKEKREPTSFSHSVKVLYAKVDEQLDEAIRKFWEIETIGMMDDSDKADVDSSRPVQNFESTLQFDGIRYTVRLPWLKDDAPLPNNYHQALRRLQQIERSLKNDPRKAAHYERAMYVIRHHVKKYQHQFPEAVNEVLENMYVDDLLYSVDEEESASEMVAKLKKMIKLGGFLLTKRKQQPHVESPWNNMERRKDELYPTPSNVDPNALDTKLQLISTTAKMYDTLGYLSPYLITAKILFQRLWQQGVDWDEKLPDNVHREWKKWKMELMDIPEK
ncbi:hypothetical protein T05_15328 [Trichinella murrelli]|uniref:Integrase catalytic domain-containing protein n=1 Tax=Trichinella murrelli TaxID=144512 RepID=A0A0V0U717_9BILA|nr:hypothetical protein T05_15328 [Trichinella murrelli]